MLGQAPLTIYTDSGGNSYVLNELTGDYLAQIPSEYDVSKLTIYKDGAGNVYVLDNETGEYVVEVPYKYATTAVAGGGIIDQLKSFYQSHKMLSIGGVMGIGLLLFGGRRMKIKGR